MTELGQPTDMGSASALQAQMWAVDRLRGGDAGYLTCEVLRIEGVVDPVRLRRCLTTLMLRHETLTTGFRLDQGGLLRVRADSPGGELQERDLTDTADPTEAFSELVRRSLRQPMPLDRPPLLRWLLGTTQTTSYLAVVLHHIVADGWSVDILLDELAALYAGEPLPTAPAAYGDYTRELARDLADGSLDREKAFWRTTLDAAPIESTVPGVGLRQSYRGDRQVVDLPAMQLSAVTRLAGRAGVTPFMIYLAALAVVVASRAGTRDVVLGVPSANRVDDRYQGTVGPFMNPLPVRVRMTGGLTGLGLLQQVRDALLGAIEFQRLPLSSIVKEHATPVASTLTPVFQVVAAQRVFATGSPTFGGHPGTRMFFATGTAKYDLALTFPQEHADRALAVEYDLGRYDARFVAALAADYLDTLTRLLDDPAAPCLTADLPPTHDRGREGRVVRRHRGHPAVVQGTDWLSYGEIEERSSRIGAALQSRGIGNGGTVMVDLPRGIDSVLASLGVLSAGATCIPAAPSRSPERSAGLLSTCRAAVVAEHHAVERQGSGGCAPAVPRWCLDDLLAGALDDAPGSPLPGSRMFPVNDGDPGLGSVLAESLGHRTAAGRQSHVIQPRDRVAHFAEPGSEAGLVEISSALGSGATLVIPTRRLNDPHEYAELLTQCTVALLPGALFAELAAARVTVAALRRLDLLMVDGDRLDPKAVAQADRPDRRLDEGQPTVLGHLSVPIATPSPGADPPAETATSVDDGDQVQERLRAVWAEVLGCAVTAGTDFFAAGGDSMAAIGMLARVDGEFEVAVAPDDLFDNATFAAFVDRVRDLLMIAGAAHEGVAAGSSP
ncbi:condensation domain-containing protein [Micromonospora sp. NPDC051925]|uniref:condensation domain-containing protein n=1 Tax=Micromonospora sp. NPDC051925 TaxID=3364288 RepID=UPI0037C6B931